MSTLLLALLLSVVTPPMSASADNGAIITGRIVLGTSNVPAGADVMVTAMSADGTIQQTVSTNSSGVFTVTNLPEELFNLQTKYTGPGDYATAYTVAYSVYPHVPVPDPRSTTTSRLDIWSREPSASTPMVTTRLQDR